LESAASIKKPAIWAFSSYELILELSRNHIAVGFVFVKNGEGTDVILYPEEDNTLTPGFFPTLKSCSTSNPTSKVCVVASASVRPPH
jgi:hypothetical protein